jgi:hypothetical protein
MYIISLYLYYNLWSTKIWYYCPHFTAYEKEKSRKSGKMRNTDSTWLTHQSLGHEAKWPLWASHSPVTNKILLPLLPQASSSFLKSNCSRVPGPENPNQCKKIILSISKMSKPKIKHSYNRIPQFLSSLYTQKILKQLVPQKLVYMFIAVLFMIMNRKMLKHPTCTWIDE